MFYFSICNLWMKDTSKKLTRKLISERKTNLAYLEDDLINIFRSRPKYFISGSNMIRKMFEKIKRGTSRRFWEKCKHFNWLSASATANCFACFDWISQILLFSSRGPAVENPGATWTDSAQIQILFCFYSSLLHFRYSVLLFLVNWPRERVLVNCTWWDAAVRIVNERPFN